MAYYNSYHSLLREMNLEADSSDDDEAPIINLESDEDEMWVQPIRQKQAAKRKKKPAGPARKVHGFTESKVGDADEVLENYFEKKGLVKEVSKRIMAIGSEMLRRLLALACSREPD